jgi:hypothetical protein
MKLSDMKAVEAWSARAMLPIGLHTVTILEAEEKESSGGNPQFELEFGNDLGTIRDWLTYTPKSAGKIRQFLDAIGIPPEDGDMEVTDHQLVGKALMIRIIEEPDREDPTKMRSRVATYEPVTDASNGAPKPDDDDLPF